MKVHVSVTDDAGNTYEGEANLQATARTAGRARGSAAPPPRSDGGSGKDLDFSMSNRAFIKQHAGRLGGAARFTLLLAKLAGGKVGTTIELRDITAAWNSMTALLGGRFNPAHTTRAKDQGWVDTRKTGSYVLCPGWRAALGKKGVKAKTA